MAHQPTNHSTPTLEFVTAVYDALTNSYGCFGAKRALATPEGKDALKAAFEAGESMTRAVKRLRDVCERTIEEMERSQKEARRREQAAWARAEKEVS